MPTLMDFNSFEQWNAEGARDHDRRGLEKARNMLLDYQEPKLGESVAEALNDFVARREKGLPDTVN
jgi:trimethylamine--corrinoid protein Co-methyltransferase